LDKSVLERYCAAQGRIKQLNKRIREIRNKIERIGTSGERVVDSVKGTRKDGTYGNIRIEGFPLQEYEDARELLISRKTVLEAEEKKLLRLTNDVEEYISTVDDPEMKTILTLYYLEGRTWQRVANAMNTGYGRRGKSYTSDSCRMALDRFIKKI